MQSVSGGGAAGQQGGLTGTGVQGTASGEAASESREQGEHTEISIIRGWIILPL